MLLLLFFSILLSRQSLAVSSCLQPFVPENGHVIFNEPGPYAPRTVAKYSCALGFERVGREERTCRTDGSWSGEPPLCAIDVAAMKPMTQSSGGSSYPLSRGLCTITENEKRSWWEVDLLGAFSVHSISLRLGKQSSPIASIEMMLDNGDIKLCDISSLASSGNVTASVVCSHPSVSRIRIVTATRLQLCQIHVYATNAVSAWQCAQGSMDIVGVFEGMCYAASKEEQNDWIGAQRKCLDRGASLPLRIGESARRGLRSALASSPQHQNSYFWIGVSSSTSDWRWADGEGVASMADWPPGTSPAPSPSEAVVLAGAVDWRWLPAKQNTWNAFLCQSKPKFCTSPGVGEAGRVVFSSHSYAIGTYCFYSCDDGYELSGDSQRECRDDGRWSGSIPKCLRRDCGEVPSWPMGLIRLLNGSTLYQHQVSYSCHSGWEVVGEPRRTCQTDGNWSGSEPTCREVDCGRPPPISNGRSSFDSSTYQSMANYSCAEGFRLVGHDTVFCGEKGAWEPTSPVCYDLATLREMNLSTSDASSTEGNAVLALVALLLIAFLVFAVFKFSRPAGVAPSMDKMGSSGHVIYATPSMTHQYPPPPGTDNSVIYYASCAAMTHMELPPHMLQLQQLPNGNIHVTLPMVAGRPLTRPPLPVFNAHSPTPSQLLYSFDHEPIYDTPPDITGDTLKRIDPDNLYERLPDRPPPLPKGPPPSD